MGDHIPRTPDQTSVEKEINASINREVLAPLAFSMPLDGEHSERDFKFCSLVGFGGTIEESGKLIGLERNQSYKLAKKYRETIEAFRIRASDVSRSLSEKNTAMLNVALNRTLGKLLQREDDIKPNELVALSKVVENLFRTSILLQNQADGGESVKPHREEQVKEVQAAQKKLIEIQKKKRDA